MLKRNIFAQAMLSFAFILPLTSCDAHSHASKDYKYDDEYHWKICDECGEEFGKEKHQFVTSENGEVCSICDYHLGGNDDDNFSKWVEIRDRMLSLEKYIYTIDSTQNMYDEDNNIIISTSEYSSRNYNAFFIQKTEGKFNYGIKVFQTTKKSVDVVKEVKVDGKNKMKHYQFSWDKSSGKEVKKGYYVNPTYANTLEVSTVEGTFNDYFLNSGNTLNEFTMNFKKNLFGEMSNNFDLTSEIIKDKEGYSLLMKISGTYIDSYNDNSNYLNTNEEYNIEFTMYESNFCNIDVYNKTTENMKDGSKNITRLEQINRLQNVFQEETYNNYDMVTSETINAYYVPVNYYLNGYLFAKEIGSALYEEVFKEEIAHSFLVGCNNFINDIYGSGISRSTSFSLYSDKNLTSPLTDNIVLNDEINVYIKPDYSKGGYVQMMAKDSEGNFRVNALFFVERGKTFTTSLTGEDYKLVSIDGKAVEEGASLSININENRTYIVMFEEI